MSLIELLGLGGIGLFVGVTASIFGLGGGVLITPLLPLVLPLPQRDVVATSLATVLMVTGGNVIDFARRGLVVWRIGIVFGIAAAGGAAMAAYTAGYLPNDFLRLLTFFVLVALSVSLLRPPSSSPPLERPLRFWPLATVAGFAAGMTGVGTGAVLSPFFLAKKVVQPKEVSPTANVVLVFASIAGVITYIFSALREGRNPAEAVNPWVVLSICVPAYLTAYFGRGLQTRMKDRTRRLWMASLVAILAVLVIFPLVMRYVR